MCNVLCKLCDSLGSIPDASKQNHLICECNAHKDVVLPD